MFAVYPVFLTLCALILNFHPLPMLINCAYPDKLPNYTSILFLLVKAPFIALVCVHVCRSFANVISHSTVLIHMVLSCIDRVVLDGKQLSRGTMTSSQNLRGYVQIQVLLGQLPLAAFETIVASLMLLGLLVCVTFNYVTISHRS